MMKYYISDCHFFHRNVDAFDSRGFETMFQMHEEMMKKWNERIKDEDEVYIIGDFSFGKGVETWEILNKLRGKLILIEGNHDFHYLDDKEFVDTIFDDIVYYAEIKDSGRDVVLSHYPIFFYNHQFKADKENKPLTYMLYGHVHNTYDEYLVNHFINEASHFDRIHTSEIVAPTPINLINTFCLFSNYYPLTLDEWIAVDAKRRLMINAYEEMHGPIDYDGWNELNAHVIEQSYHGWNLDLETI